MTKRIQLYFSLLFLFILGSSDGFIALWKDSDPEPVRVFPYSIASLPEADRRALEQGIRIRSETDLTRLLEDYLS